MPLPVSAGGAAGGLSRRAQAFRGPVLLSTQRRSVTAFPSPDFSVVRPTSLSPCLQSTSFQACGAAALECVPPRGAEQSARGASVPPAGVALVET